MKSIPRTLLLLLLVFMLINVILVKCADTIYFFDETEGSSCISSKGKNGTCTKSEYCPIEYKTNSTSDICTITNGIEIVCCINREKSEGNFKEISKGFENNVTVDDAVNNDEEVNNTETETEEKRLSEHKYDEYMDKIFSENSNQLEELNGRQLTLPGEYPHMSAIGIKMDEQNVDWKCGGSLISEDYVLTAAHCTSFNGQIPNIVSVGDLNLRVKEKTLEPQTFGINNIIVYPDYHKKSYYHDIALIQLSTHAHFTVFVRPACLWGRRRIPYNHVIAMGYGSTEYGRASRNELTEMILTTIPNRKCNRRIPFTQKILRGILRSQICAMDFHGNSDTCQGDSGGPLQLNIPRNDRMEYFLVGITSFGLGCGGAYPGIYTRIHSYLNWIESIVWRNDIFVPF